MEQAEEDFIVWVKEHNDWYEEQSNRWIRLLNVCKTLTFVSSLISIVLAASATKEFFADIGKWLIVGATVLSAGTSEFLAQFQVRRMEELRENGNLETAHL